MKRTEITDIIARKYKKNHPDNPLARSIIAEVVDLFVGIIEDSLIEFGEFALSNLFRLYTFKSKRNKGFNGFTGEYISYEPSYNLKVHASKQLRSKLNIAKENKTNNSAREE